MPIAWYESPYLAWTDAAGNPRRKVALDEATPQIDQDGGYWSESEQDGDRAIVCVRASLALHANLGSSFTRLPDPRTVWTNTRHEPSGKAFPTRLLEDVRADVLDEVELAALKLRRDALIARADQEGYVRIPDRWGLATARLLVLLGKRGYGLDRVSTGTFPTTSVLDAFTGADGTTPPNSNWTNGRHSSDPNVKISSNAVVTNDGGGADGSIFWNPGTFGADSEDYATIIAKGAAFSEGTLFLRLTDGDSTTQDSYQFTATPRAGTDLAQFWRAIDNSYSQLGANVSQEWAVAEKIGGEVIGSTLTFYRYSGGSWAALDTRSDSNLTTAGNIGLAVGSTWSLDDFGGGTVVTAGPVIPVFMAQYRQRWN